jgi:hypothetical protein
LRAPKQSIRRNEDNSTATVARAVLTTPCTRLALLMAAVCGACSTPSREAACLGTPAAPGYFQGTGSGPNSREARAAAEAELCRSIRVEISSRLETAERSSVRGREAEEYSRIIRQVEAQEAHCVFEGLPVEARIRGDAPIGYCVVVRLAEHEYRRYLDEHRTTVTVDTDVPDLPLEAVRGAVFEWVRHTGYVPVDGQTAGLPFATRADVRVEVQDTGVEGMQVARGRVEITTRGGDERVAAHVAPAESVARGFERGRVLGTLAEALAAALRPKATAVGP